MEILNFVAAEGGTLEDVEDVARIISEHDAGSSVNAETPSAGTPSVGLPSLSQVMPSLSLDESKSMTVR